MPSITVAISVVNASIANEERLNRVDVDPKRPKISLIRSQHWLPTSIGHDSNECVFGIDTAVIYDILVMHITVSLNADLFGQCLSTAIPVNLLNHTLLQRI